MAWRVWAERLLTADLDGSNARVYQPFKPNSNIILVGVRIWVVAYNDPAFTSLQGKIYSNNGGVPGKLLATSTNAVTKADILGGKLAACREIPLKFNNFNMKDTDTYHFMLAASGYTSNWPTAGLAWRKGWPYPVYSTGVVTTLLSLGVSPYTLYGIGAEL